MIRTLFAAAFLALAPLALSSQAQASGFVVEISPGAADVPLATPKPLLPSGDPTGVATEVWEALRRDLQISGYFKMIDPAAYIERDKGVEPGTFDFADWKTIDAHVLVKTRWWPAGSPTCDPSGAKACLDVFVYYAITGEKLIAKRLKADGKAHRTLAHSAANEVLQAVTGQPGPFGARLAAVGTQGGNKELYLLDLDGQGVSPATRNGSINLSPALSADGRLLAYTSYKRGNPDLYIKDLSTGRTRTLSRVNGMSGSPAFSPDSSKVAIARSTDGDSDIFLVDTKTGAEISRVTKGGGIDVSPQFSPDGGRLIYASERSGGSQIYVQDLASGQASRVTFAGDFNTDPTFSPDGKHIAFVGRSGGKFDVYVADVDGQNLVRLTQDMGNNEDPTWSADSRYLVFCSDRSGKKDLWMSTADGRNQMALTRTGGWTQPVWVPEGR